MKALLGVTLLLLSASLSAQPVNDRLDYDAQDQDGAIVIVVSNTRPGTSVLIREVVALSSGTGKSVTVPVNAKVAYGQPLRVRLGEAPALAARLHSDREIPGYRKITAGTSPYCTTCGPQDSFVLALPFSVKIKAAYSGKSTAETVSPAYLYYYVDI